MALLINCVHQGMSYVLRLLPISALKLLIAFFHVNELPYIVLMALRMNFFAGIKLCFDLSMKEWVKIPFVFVS